MGIEVLDRRFSTGWKRNFIYVGRRNTFNVASAVAMAAAAGLSNMLPRNSVGVMSVSDFDG